MRPGWIAFVGLFCVLGAIPAPAATVRVTMDKMAFSPAEVTAKVGDTIEWINKDFLQHSATAADKSWDVVLPQNKTGHIVVKAPGTIDYFCKYHPNMKGKITVTP
jgi:plastocyanin